jgi:peptidyl-prolyl cis-trans isomerase SurA
MSSGIQYMPALCRPLLGLLFAAVVTLPLMAAAPPPAGAGPAGKAAATPPGKDPSAMAIVAVVNGDVITNADVSSRGRLFALSTEVLARLRPQITRQLIEERLHLQEIQRRHIVVQDKEIAAAIREIESRNNLPPGLLRQRLAADGTGMRTLIDQIRAQIGWTQALRQQIGERVQITPAEIEERQKLQDQQTGKPEFRILEIFIPVEDPAHTTDAEKFAETVVGQLRAGAPFQIVAAQFSQSQTALQGGDLGWLQENRLDPEVLRIAQQMPVGAISNAVRVPGGFSIITLAGRRELGNEIATMVSLRQVFLPFSTPLNPQQPTEQQRLTLEKAKALSGSIHSCEAMEAANLANKSPRPANPGDVRLERVAPPSFREVLTNLPLDRATQPLVAADGIAVIIVCSREKKNVAHQTKEEIEAQMVNERVELLSRQMLRDLRRRATIEQRSAV